jgi:hypothetical protein
MCTLFGVAYLINEHIVYVVVDLKVLEVLVRSFNCENRACYVGNPRESSSSRK